MNIAFYSSKIPDMYKKTVLSNPYYSIKAVKEALAAKGIAL